MKHESPLPGMVLENLEARIAPASFGFVDVDGDEVTITTSKGTAADIEAAVSLVAMGDGYQLKTIDLGSNPIFAGSSLTIAAKRTTFSGDGLVHVGVIDGGSLNFTKITVDGDLGKIVTGSGEAGKKAVTVLQAFSLGAKGTSTGADNLVSVLSGSVGEIRILTDIDTAAVFLPVSGSKLGKLIVGEDIIGGVTDQSGSVVVAGTLSSVSLGGSLIGGTGDESGRVSAALMTSLVIKGALIGGGGEDSGTVEVSGSGAASSSFRVGLDVTGGDGVGSGVIRHAGSLRSLTVAGNLIGGAGWESGSVRAESITTLVHGESIFGKSGLDSGMYRVEKLGTVRVGGDIFGGSGEGSGGIRAGAEIKQVTVGGSLYGNSVDDTGYIVTDATGRIGKLTLGGNLFGSGGEASGQIATGTLSKAVVGGSLFGGGGDFSGSLVLETGYGSVKIGQDLKGGGGEFSGGIQLTGTQSQSAGDLQISGRVVGGTGEGSGSVLAAGSQISAKTLKIGGAIEGGSGAQSGRIDVKADFRSVSVGGLIRGGEGTNSGSLRVGSAGTLSVAGDVRGGLNSSGSGSIVVSGSVKTLSLGGLLSGGTNQTANPMTDSGAVLVGGNIDKMSLAGSLQAGNANTEDDLNLGAIRAGGSIGSLTIGGSVQGSGSMDAFITAKGNISPTGTKNLAIGSISIAGSVLQAWILAGYDTHSSAVNGDGGALGGSAQIGTISVSGNWIASSLVAGATTGLDGYWGSATNALLPKSNSALIASIARISIGGAVAGLPGVQNGFVAEAISEFVAGGDALLIPPGPFSTQIGPLSTQEIRVV